MSVRICKRGRKWYVYVTHHGERKAKCVGRSRQAAEQVRRKIEERLALGDLGFLEAEQKQVPSFNAYSQLWLEQYAKVECKTLDGSWIQQHIENPFGSRVW